MQRLARPFDGTLPVQVLLYDDESIITAQEGVGLYDGPDLIAKSFYISYISHSRYFWKWEFRNQKSLDHQSGTVHVTTHRLIYVDSVRPNKYSIAFSLSSIIQTEYYAGFLTSSAKVTVHFSKDSIDDIVDQVESWVCQVCDYKNPPGLGDTALKCHLCGVTRTQTHVTTIKQNTIYSGNIPPAMSASAGAVSPRPTQDPIPCSACTFLNHPSLRACEICGTPLESQPLLVVRNLKSAPTSRPDTPTANIETDFIKISFRKGGDKPFYAALKRTLMGKSWEAKSKSLLTNQRTDSTTHARSGIHGILQNVEQNAKAANDTLHEALNDMEALMVKARDMVDLASSLNAKLTAQEEQRDRLRALHPELAMGVSDEPEEAKFIRSSLSQLGLQSTAITADMVKDEREWFEQLARELGTILLNSNREGFMRDRGIIGLDEIWGGWNRARGVALIPPETMLMCLTHLPMVTNPPIHLRTFRTGLKVLHTPHYSTSAFTDRLISKITLMGPQSTMNIAMTEKITNSLALEMIEAVEEIGDVIRDEQGPGGNGNEIIWWQNSFREYIWDGA
ncbi:hypothetical protein Clacol_003502 [Clathrus columnatus]|uniref:Vacuolar protein-sorting-associated protein 36 n=1 Tax=Clathrus columnatus TaxID=1419009 RepID=A0AAV5ABH5_9AGAM|nr:hypothetical protein Clacol_003502 [Clathrus columnatus]